MARAAELNNEAALMDCDAALDMRPGHVKAKFRKAMALWRPGRTDEARAVGEAAMRGAPNDEMEREARLLLRSMDQQWSGPPEAETEAGRGADVMRPDCGDVAVVRPDFAAGRRTVNCENTNRHGETATDEAPSLFASTAVRFGAAEEDERARFVSDGGGGDDAGDARFGGFGDGCGRAGGGGRRTLRPRLNSTRREWDSNTRRCGGHRPRCREREGCGHTGAEAPTDRRTTRGVVFVWTCLRCSRSRGR